MSLKIQSSEAKGDALSLVFHPVAMATSGEMIKAALKQKKLSQREFSTRLDLSESAVSQWVNDVTAPDRDRVGEVAKVLSLDLSTLQAAIDETFPRQQAFFPAANRSLAPASRAPAANANSNNGPDLAVFASAAGGPEGAWVLSSEPVAWTYRDGRLVGIPDAFACYVMGDSMEKAYEQGNLLLVNPVAPPAPGDDVLLVQTASDGNRYALIKRLVRATAAAWTVKQWNPEKSFTLPRREWQQAFLVIGKYNRS